MKQIKNETETGDYCAGVSSENARYCTRSALRDQFRTTARPIVEIDLTSFRTMSSGTRIAYSATLKLLTGESSEEVGETVKVIGMVEAYTKMIQEKDNKVLVKTYLRIFWDLG